MRSLIAFIICVATLLAPMASGQNSGRSARGLLIINDRSAAKQYAAAMEYTSISSFGATFAARLVGGGTYSGLTGHVVARINYDEPDTAALIQTMKEASTTYLKAGPILKPRIESLTQALASKPAAAVETKEARIPQATFGGRTYLNVKPQNLRNGMMGFIHDSGAFSVPADRFMHANLLLYGNMFPGLQAITEFRQLLDTFVPVVAVDGKTYTGVRIASRTTGELSLSSDQGPVTATPAQLSRDVLERLEAASVREGTLKQEVEARKAAIAAQVAKEQERVIAALKERNDREAKERMAKIEAERASAAASAAMWGTIGSALVNSMLSPRAYVVY